MRRSLALLLLAPMIAIAGCAAQTTATVTVNVARSPEEAELQAQGVDVMASMFEKDEAGFTEDYDPNAEPGTIAEAGEGEGEATAEAPAEAEAEAEGDQA